LFLRWSLSNDMVAYLSAQVHYTTNAHAWAYFFFWLKICTTLVKRCLSVDRTLSTPNEECWPGVSQLPDYKSTFPSWHTNVLPHSVKNLDETGLDLLQVRIQVISIALWLALTNELIFSLKAWFIVSLVFLNRHWQICHFSILMLITADPDSDFNIRPNTNIRLFPVAE